MQVKKERKSAGNPAITPLIGYTLFFLQERVILRLWLNVLICFAILSLKTFLKLCGIVFQ